MPMPHAGLGEELVSRGYIVQHLSVGSGYTQYLSEEGAVALTKSKFYEYPFIPRITKIISQDKELSYAFASELGVTVPKTLRTTDLDTASSFLAMHKRVIVKPSDLGGGQGLSLNITTPAHLQDALLLATFNDNAPLIQEQFMGEEVRFTVIGGTVRSAILRRTPRVVGNGIKTVAELIADENTARKALIFPLLTYPQLTADIIPEHFLTDTRVLGESEVLELNTSTMIRNGASFYGIINSIHPSYIAIAEKLAQRLNPSFLVVDLMMNQWQSPADPGNYVFIEFNTAPALAVYSAIRDGDKPDVIAAIADMLEAHLKLLK